MSNNKQSSINLFIEQLELIAHLYEEAEGVNKINISIDVNEYLALKQQANAMHKEEMVDFAMKFMMQDRPIISFYNETFGARPMDMVIIEGCEYLEYSSGHRYSLCHKGNCKNPIHPENKGGNK